MTAGRDAEGQGSGGFRWNLTPGASGVEQPGTDPEASEASEAPAPVDDWDVPTAASPIIARSVFPLGAPSRTPALLPPPFVPPPAALEAPLAAPPLPPPLDTALEGVTEVLGVHPVGLADPVGEGLETSAIDALFGESKFVDYDAGPAVAGLLVPPATTMSSTSAFPPVGALPPTALPGFSPPVSSLPFEALPGPPAAAIALYEGPRPAAPRSAAPRTMPRPQKILLWIAGALVACLALIALFLLGMRIGQSSTAAEQAAVPTSTPSATIPSEPVATAGPVAPGDHSWDELLGGECLTLYESPWQDTHTVVDCADAHTAQMLSRVTLPDAAGAPYPEPAVLQSAITGACAATTVLDYGAAGAADDIQLEASYPATAEQWDAGERTTYCFVTRAGGGDLTGSLAVPAA